MWTWLGFMNPQSAVWWFAASIPFSLLVGLATLAGVLVTQDRQAPSREPEVWLIGAFWGFTAVTTALAVYPADSWPIFVRVSKILVMIFVTLMVIRTRTRLRYLLVVSALSLGYFGLKGGIWAIATGGENRLWGPGTSFIADNNAIALALNMTLPLLFFLGRTEERRWLRLLFFTTLVLTPIAILSTYSRGGFVTMLVVVGLLLWKTKWKVLVVPAAVAFALVLVVFLPGKWFDRMHTIADDEQDHSVESRYMAWRVGWQLALDYPLAGGGFTIFGHLPVWQRVYPDYPRDHNAHNIYFLVLGEHGFPGFLLFFSVPVCTFLALRRIRREAPRVEGAAWMVDYAEMVRISLVAYLLSGMVYNMAYFDFYYLLVVTTVVLKQLLREAKARALSEAEAGGFRLQPGLGPAVA